MTEKPKAQVLMGGVGSPYTRKMLAVMRFRNIPYRFERQSRLFDDGGGNPHFPRRAQPKVPLLPTFYFEDEAGEEVAVTDSTPIIRRLEEEHEGRSVIPSDPVLAFVDLLLEDFGDEWLTKAMFHYRWYYEADIEKAGDILPLHGAVSADAQHRTVRARAADFPLALRGLQRNDPADDRSELRALRRAAGSAPHPPALPHGERPGSCDFAVYSQLTCLRCSIRRRRHTSWRITPGLCLRWSPRGPFATGCRRVTGWTWTTRPRRSSISLARWAESICPICR